MKILLTRRLHDFAVKELKKRYQVEIHTGKIPISKDSLISKIKDKDGLICYPYDRIDSDVINAGTRLKAISTFSVGYNHIDVNTALKKGITVSYTPEVLTKATADLTVALVLALFRRVCEGDRLIRKNEWRTIFGPYEFLGTDLSGKTLGIFGMGRIGKAVAKRALGFEMKLLYHNRKRLSPQEEKRLNAKYVSLDELFRRSDVVSIHAPYTPKTHEIVNLKRLKSMKKTSFLVNTARGKIINEKDLVAALKKKIIAGAALDVFQNEPIGISNHLTGLRNVLITPHIGSATVETRREMAEITVKNLILSLAGKKPIYQVKVESGRLGRF
ncbi:D-3-phosphoglycerate dehydrogenase [Candidatus Nitrosotalea sp. TS]|uniref:2-hydroxyacid dehydrogenase n=1 Tax=Candidatus Nitrosotalea sp. TS TaxID=2341020 RepID=UPI00140B1B4C|nr:D-glycerate dehydrogenase [Candidatus Nitrosotalea sp. TS]NHI04446.1 D-3-phosphoglycerate dehydrogenase [Candidatus Nitrosotalea sp. TS]